MDYYTNCSNCCESNHTQHQCSSKCHYCDLIESIALTQAGLSHILNAEGEKIQCAVAQCSDPCTLLAINDSVIETIKYVTSLEIALYNQCYQICNHEAELSCHCTCQQTCTDYYGRRK